MSTHTFPQPLPVLINVMVTVTPGDKPGDYTLTCLPDPIKVKTRAVINFYLAPGTPDDIVFTRHVKEVPAHTHQLSKPSVSTDGKMLTINDINTIRDCVAMTLHVIDKDQRTIPFDPQVLNEPRQANEE